MTASLEAGGCNPAFDNRRSRELGLPEHQYVHVDEEYDSLANGGSYDILDCVNCGRRAYSPLPD